MELLQEYGVDYVYIDNFLLTRPMVTILEHEDYLKENGINYTIQNVRLDPSTMDAPAYDSLVVMPQQLRIMEYNITSVAKQFVAGDQLHSAFYRIVI